MAFNRIIPFIFAGSSRNNCILVYTSIMFDALSFWSRLSDRSCSQQLEKKSYNAYSILFIFIDIDNTYTCTYVVSRLFAPRTKNYIQVVLPEIRDMNYKQRITNGAMKITDVCLYIKKNLSSLLAGLSLSIYCIFKISCNPQVKKLRCS